MTDSGSTVPSPDQAASYLRDAIVRFVLDNPENQQKEIDGAPFYEEPLISFADGDDPLFTEFKTIIGDYHSTPRELLEGYMREYLGIGSPRVDTISVIAYILPIDKLTRASNRPMTRVPSRRWNHTRFPGQEFNEKIGKHIISLIEGLGGRAMIPDHTTLWKQVTMPTGASSTWSHRHAAYVAGLGTFGLSDGLITPKGVAMRCGSIITDLPLPAQPRPYANHLANCAFYVDRSCTKCIQRCPVGAISEQGHDKIKCREYMMGAQLAWAKEHTEGYYYKQYVGCGLCLTKVPCEASIPKIALV